MTYPYNPKKYKLYPPRQAEARQSIWQFGFFNARSFTCGSGRKKYEVLKRTSLDAVLCHRQG